MRLSEIVSSWSADDRADLWRLIGPKDDVRAPSSTEIEERFHALFNNIVRTGTKTTSKNAVTYLRSKATGREFEPTTVAEQAVRHDYEGLLRAACKELKIEEADSTTEERELYLSQDVLLSALKSMKPKERAAALSACGDVSGLGGETGVDGRHLKGPATVLGAMAVAQASGFGIYLAATTALGFVSSLLGITLSFAAYTGLTTALSIAIGPLGFGAGLTWAVYKATGPKWRRIIPGLIHVASVRHRP